MKLDIYQVDAFTTTPFAGNPAAVVPLASAAGSVPAAMLAVRNAAASPASTVHNRPSRMCLSFPGFRDRRLSGPRRTCIIGHQRRTGLCLSEPAIAHAHHRKQNSDERLAVHQ